MTSPAHPNLADIFAARHRLARHLNPSPLRVSDWLSSHTNAHVRLKLESVQTTGSFKVRGALNAALCLTARDRNPHVVTASAGNHGRAVSYAARLLKLRATVFTPSTAPETKKAWIRRAGAILRDDAPDYDHAERLAREYATTAGGVYVSPYNHVDVIAGAGTIGLEILEAAPDLDVIVVPLGGGGLAAGVALAIKNAAPRVTVVGVEVEASTPFFTGFQHGAITTIDVQPSLADGLIGNLEPASMTFALVHRYVDRLVRVSEQALQRAMRDLAHQEHLMVEGAGATATAAVLAADVVPAQSRAVVLVTGSNIDLHTFLRVVAGS
jgi:threonine dehydratase